MWNLMMYSLIGLKIFKIMDSYFYRDCMLRMKHIYDNVLSKRQGGGIKMSIKKLLVNV